MPSPSSLTDLHKFRGGLEGNRPDLRVVLPIEVPEKDDRNSVDEGWKLWVSKAALARVVRVGRFDWAGWVGPNGRVDSVKGRIEHAGPLGSLCLNGTGNPIVDFMPTGDETSDLPL
ncbi:hypothetical protein F511_40207 [Dorcoceras hygrometricum]|uniref:Uncharacterized protein n=1 Tax=Dorcoceras hygrometricum TaxID=472368 RepID=A0A2Z7BX59_9LAMI|nr:hypothetical protein F511_40207 [Dorcoceras hygrometricum]